MSTEGCLICQAPLEYLTQDEVMECAICHKKEPSKARCVKGHYGQPLRLVCRHRKVSAS